MDATVVMATSLGLRLIFSFAGTENTSIVSGRWRRNGELCITARKSQIVLQCGTAPHRSISEFIWCRESLPISIALILDRFSVSRKDCEAIIINARIKAGWIKEAAVAQPA
jgi:hypothetical protein